MSKDLNRIKRLNEELKAEPLSALEENILIAVLNKKLYWMEIFQAFYETTEVKDFVNVCEITFALTRLKAREYIASTFIRRPDSPPNSKAEEYYETTDRGAIALSKASKRRRDLYKWQAKR